MFESALLTEFVQCLIVAFFLIPLCQTLSLHAIQIYVIIKHGLPLSGIKLWRGYHGHVKTLWAIAHTRVVKKCNSYLKLKCVIKFLDLLSFLTQSNN